LPELHRDVSTLTQKAEKVTQSHSHMLSGIRAYRSRLTQEASGNILGIQLAEWEHAVSKTLSKEPPAVEEILLHRGRSETPLLC
jgi:hypothetical protein